MLMAIIHKSSPISKEYIALANVLSYTVYLCQQTPRERRVWSLVKFDRYHFEQKIQSQFLIRNQVKWTCLRAIDAIEPNRSWISINWMEKCISIDSIDITFRFNFEHVTTLWRWQRRNRETKREKERERKRTHDWKQTENKIILIFQVPIRNITIYWTYWSIGSFSVQTSRTTHTPNRYSN